MKHERYVPTDWKDLPDESTPITAEKLKYIESGIITNEEAVYKLNEEVERLKKELLELKGLVTNE